MGNDANRHNPQKRNPLTAKKIPRVERQGLHPHGARQPPARERRGTLSATCAGHYLGTGREAPMRENCKSLSNKELGWLGGRDANSEGRVLTTG